MATGVSIRFSEGRFTVLVDEHRKKHRTHQIKPGRICDGCLNKHAVTWSTFQPNNTAYLPCDYGATDNIAVCSDCLARSQVSKNEEEETANQRIAKSLQPANRRRYERSVKWNSICSRILKRDEGTCRLCLSSPAAAIHHFSYSNYGDEFFYELIAVCHKCHLDYHTNMDAYNREWWTPGKGHRKRRFPDLGKSKWRLSSHTATALGTKSEKPNHSTAGKPIPSPLTIREDIWYCECKAIACYPHLGNTKRHSVAKGCKQCGDFHKVGYFKRMPACEPKAIDDRILEFTNARLDTLARNRFAMFYWVPAIQKLIEASWPCKCSRTRSVFRTCELGVEYYGKQCLQCGMFRDAKRSRAFPLKNSHEYDPGIALKFRRNQYSEHLNRIVDIEIEKLQLQKASEAEKLLESGVLRMRLNTERIKNASCFRCHSSSPKNIWFRFVLDHDYFNCLDLAPFCDGCYSHAVIEFSKQWNPIVIPLPSCNDNFSETKPPQQLTLF